MSKIYDFKLNALQGGKIDFSDFRGKKILIVNTASACGYTSQYAQMQELYEARKEELVVVGCPCNQFGAQESGTEVEIANFCQINYGVSFPMSAKLNVKGEDAHPLFQYLCDRSKNGKVDAQIGWNFNKFLVDETGQVLSHHVSGTSVFEIVD